MSNKADKQFMRAIRNMTKAWEKGYSDEKEDIKRAIKLLEGAEMYIAEQKAFLKSYLKEEGDDSE